MDWKKYGIADERDMVRYCEALAESVRYITFHRSDKEVFPLEDLFYPLNIDDGIYAVASYNQVIRRSRMRSETGDDSSGTDAVSGGDEASGEAAAPEALMLPGHGESRFFCEEDPARYPLGAILFDDVWGSRVLVLASAGHGKTTLLERLSLYYCEKVLGETESEEDIMLAGKYYLPDRFFLPVLVRVRSLEEPGEAEGYDLTQIIAKQAAAVRQYEAARRLTGKRFLEAAVNAAGADSLLLLIDGLDELTDRCRNTFLRSLASFLEDHPAASVVMTSRVAGIYEEETKAVLAKMRFHMRSLIPLSDEQTEVYARRWIGCTQPPDQTERLFARVSEILSLPRYRYLKPFMQTPLELIIILRQIASGTIAGSRHQIFQDMLWEIFTSHEQPKRRAAVFSDLMTLLGYLAWCMQVKGRLSASKEEIRDILPGLGLLSFRTTMMGAKSLPEITAILDDLTSNTGIIEQQTGGYVFPVRTYQEILTAHACCHIPLRAGQRLPDPAGLLAPHMNDSGWLNIISFALDDLYREDPEAHAKLFSALTEHMNDMTFLRQMCETGFQVDRSQAGRFAKRHFRDRYLSGQQQELLYQCLTLNNATPFILSILRLQQAEGDNGDFLEAAAAAEIIRCRNHGSSLTDRALELLSGTGGSTVMRGMQMARMLLDIMLDNGIAVYLRGFQVLLRGMRAEERKDYAAGLERVIDLAAERAAHLPPQEILFTEIAGRWHILTEGRSQAALRGLSLQRERSMIAMLQSMEKDAGYLCVFPAKRDGSAAYAKIRCLSYALGCFPYHPEWMGILPGTTYVALLMEYMYEEARGDGRYDAAAMLMARARFAKGQEWLIREWVMTICEGRPSSSVIFRAGNVRRAGEASHCRLMSRELAVEEERFWSSLPVNYADAQRLGEGGEGEDGAGFE